MSQLIQSLLEQIPKSVDTTHLKDFLQTQTLGTCDIIWPYTPANSEFHVGFRFTRSPKEPGAYYRDPYPLTVSTYSPSYPGLPKVETKIDSQDVTTLLTSLQKQNNE